MPWVGSQTVLQQSASDAQAEPLVRQAVGFGGKPQVGLGDVRGLQ